MIHEHIAWSPGGRQATGSKGMSGRAEQIDTPVDIINIRANLIAHGNSIAGTGGAGKHMDRLAAIVRVEDGLEFLHEFLVMRKCSGCLDGSPCMDLNFGSASNGYGTILIYFKMAKCCW